MMTAREAWRRLSEGRESRGPLRTTGFAELDELTGGFAPGQLWIVTGSPGQGRSALAAQWAWTLAHDHRFVTQLITKRDPEWASAARWAAQSGRILLRHLLRPEGPQPEDVHKVDQTAAALQAAPLSTSGPVEASFLDPDMAGVLEPPEALVIDDVDLAADLDPTRVAELVRRGMTVVVTMPRDGFVRDGEPDPTWTRWADFVLDINRPEVRDVWTERPGEVDLLLLRNRWGPAREIVVCFQGHYARFADPATPIPARGQW